MMQAIAYAMERLLRLQCSVLEAEVKQNERLRIERKADEGEDNKGIQLDDDATTCYEQVQSRVNSRSSGQARKSLAFRIMHD
ncbi:hypothetical protein MRB53_041592 [Persea americana]|nr:hypothetical protein MRB53_041592 [Persea americana]